MSLARMEYFKDLLRDAVEAVGGEDKMLKVPEVVAALILADAINGHRKALLDISEAIRVARRSTD